MASRKRNSKKSGFFAPNDSTSSLKASGNSPLENSDDRKLSTIPQMLAYKAAGMASTEATSLQEKIFKGVLLQQMVQTSECDLQKNRNEELEEVNRGLRDMLLEQRKDTRTNAAITRTAALRKTINTDALAVPARRTSERLQDKKKRTGFMNFFSKEGGGKASRKKRSYGKYKKYSRKYKKN